MINQETPYPETGEEGPEQTGGNNFPAEVPPLDLAPPDQQQQLPTISPITPWQD